MRLLTLPLCGLMLFATSVAFAQPATRSLIKQIEQAERHLQQTETAIVTARTGLVQQVQQLENDVLSLTQQTRVARRLADESTLSLSQLEQRLQAWRQQQNYQNNLLHRFLQNDGIDAPVADFADLIGAVTERTQQLRMDFFPNWQNRPLVVNSGAVQTVATLAVGPVTWYWDEATGTGGFAEPGDEGLLHNSLVLPTTAAEALADLRIQPSGQLNIDPTMSRVMARDKNRESLPQHLAKGGLWVIPILAFALLASAIAIVKVVQLWRLPRVLRATPTALECALCDTESTLGGRFEGMQKELFNIAQHNPKGRHCDDLLFIALQEHKHRLERWIGAIAVTASVSPLLGLLGTVSGMIETFKMMTLFGSGDPEVVSGGIAQALITTELGLVVAIPALILSTILSRKARNFYMDLEHFALLLSQERDDSSHTVTAPRKSSTFVPQQPIAEALPA